MGELRVIRKNKNDIVKTISNFQLREGEKEIARFGADYDNPILTDEDGYGFKMFNFLEYSMILTNRELHIQKFINDNIEKYDIPVGKIDIKYENKTCFVNNKNKGTDFLNRIYKVNKWSIMFGIFYFSFILYGILIPKLSGIGVVVGLGLLILLIPLLILLFSKPFLGNKLYLYCENKNPLHYKAN